MKQNTLIILSVSIVLISSSVSVVSENILSSSSSSSSLSVIGCTAEDTCLGLSSTPRCLPVAGGIPCTLDYQYNESGICGCGTEACTPYTDTNTTALPQLLIIGDSISIGYQDDVVNVLKNKFEVVHTPGNAGNTNWGNLCLRDWLSPASLTRWDVITVNFGLHDLAYPDNEHISLSNYSLLLNQFFYLLQKNVKSTAKIIWNTITPVPTNPNSSCVLIPGRIESNVLAYNAEAKSVVTNLNFPVSTCDLHTVITNYCGVGYSTCNITQCRGPHFSDAGFALLGNAVANCVQQAFDV